MNKCEQRGEKKTQKKIIGVIYDEIFVSSHRRLKILIKTVFFSGFILKQNINWFLSLPISLSLLLFSEWVLSSRHVCVSHSFSFSRFVLIFYGVSERLTWHVHQNDGAGLVELLNAYVFVYHLFFRSSFCHFGIHLFFSCALSVQCVRARSFSIGPQSNTKRTRCDLCFISNR